MHRKGMAMIRVYLYQGSGAERPDHAWQHETGQRLLDWVKKQPENGALCHYNISHSGNLVAVAAADAPVGVDVEGRRSVKERVADRVLSEKEQLYLLRSADRGMCFLQFWTLKECYGKALGVGIAYPLKQVELVPSEPVQREEWQRVSCSDAGMSCFSLLKTDYVLSVCSRSPDGEKPLFYMLQNTSLV